MSNFDELLALHKLVNRIYNSDVSWEVKYELIFSKQVSRRIRDLISFEYYDPDTSYEEDVKAFVEAFNNRMSAGR